MNLPRQPARPDYGIDAPEGLRTVTLGGLLLVGLGLGLVRGSKRALSRIAFAAGAFSLAIAAAWLASTKIGKMRLWERLLDELNLQGDERVLDAGCGRGLLLVEAAKRLTSGRAVGVDVWAMDQSGNSPTATLANADAAVVSDRLDVTSGDVSHLPFGDGSFDIVVSNLVLDNLHSEEGWTRAMRELARVTKPGGRVLVADLAHVDQYAKTLRDEGWADVDESGPYFLIFPPVRLVSGTKPG